jgi:hypothetical protein
MNSIFSLDWKPLPPKRDHYAQLEEVWGGEYLERRMREHRLVVQSNERRVRPRRQHGAVASETTAPNKFGMDKPKNARGRFVKSRKWKVQIEPDLVTAVIDNDRARIKAANARRPPKGRRGRKTANTDSTE